MKPHFDQFPFYLPASDIRMTYDHHLDSTPHENHHPHHLIHHHGEEDEEEEAREISILYATETGNAQDVAERLARLCRRLHFEVQLASLDEYQAVSSLN